MANLAPVTRIAGEWLCRDVGGKDGGGWRVRVPCQGGHGYFGIAEYGSSQKALQAAKAFHAKACRQLQKDREYYAKNGEMPHRETLNIRNRSGIPGVSRQVFPNLIGKPNVVYTAFWMQNGRQHSAKFSTAQHGTEDIAKKLAIAKREEMAKKFHGHR